LRLRSREVALAGLLVVAALAPRAAEAGSLSLAWDAVAGASGYRVYSGTSPGVYTGSVTLGAQTSYTFTNLPDCQTYYVAVKAIDSQGRLSAAYSNQIIGLPKPTVTGITPTGSPQGSTLNVTITGTNFDTQARPDFNLLNPIEQSIGPDIAVNSSGSVSCTQLNASITLAPHAWVNDATRPRVVAVVNQARQASDGNGIAGSAGDKFRVLFDTRRADIDASGRVMDRDFLLWRNAFGSAHGTPPLPPDPNYSAAVDLNGDGIVDGVDLALLVSKHAFTCDATGCHP